jgi:hypothetical protein
VVGPGPDRALVSEQSGPVLSKEPVVRVLANFLANNLGLQLGWKRACRISSVAENGTLILFAGDGLLMPINESLMYSQRGVGWRRESAAMLTMGQAGDAHTLRGSRCHGRAGGDY